MWKVHCNNTSADVKRLRPLDQSSFLIFMAEETSLERLSDLWIKELICGLERTTKYQKQKTTLLRILNNRHVLSTVPVVDIHITFNFPLSQIYPYTYSLT